MTIEKSNKSEK